MFYFIKGKGKKETKVGKEERGGKREKEVVKNTLSCCKKCV